MHVRLLVLCILILCCLTLQSKAQKDSVHLINPVLIEADVRVIYFQQGLKFENIDSTFLSNNLNLSAADVLSRMSSVYIKSYGGSGLATSSFRGGSANHTAILWNGFNLQSPVTGMIDLSLIPTGLFNSLSLQYGGKAAVWGSGAIGGTIHLKSNLNFNEGTSTKMYAGFGSYNEKNIQAVANFSNLKFSNSTKIFHSDAKNNYKYISYANEVQDTLKLSNAEANQNSLMQENKFKIKENQWLETHIWLQENKREIPPTLFQQKNDAFQEDRAMRFSGSYHRYFKTWNLNFKSAYFDEYLKYKDNEFSKLDENKSQTNINEFIINKTISRSLISMGMNNTYANSKSVEFITFNPIQNKTALFGSFQFMSKKANLIIVGSVRQEWVNTNKVPLTWSLGIDYYLKQWLKLKANASRLFRIPTLNDLFWKEGGNQNLLPENGYAFESGIQFIIPKNNKKYKLELDLTAFSRKIENWIIWLPNGNFWSPQNLMHVWSRGAETSTNFSLSMNKIKVFSHFKTSYVLSENTSSLLQNDASLNQQLIYVPIYSGQLNYGVIYNKITCMFNHTYTGYRYTSSDHSEYLIPYYLHHINLAYALTLKKMTIDFQFQVNNILNKSYQVLAARPMPGINYRAGIVFNFKSNYGKS